MLKNFLTTKSDALVAAMVPNSTEFTHALYVCMYVCRYNIRFAIAFWEEHGGIQECIF